MMDMVIEMAKDIQANNRELTFEECKRIAADQIIDLAEEDVCRYNEDEDGYPD